MALWCNPRGVEWNYDLKDIAELSATKNISKKRFLLERAVRFFFYYCLTDAVIFYGKSFGFPECLEMMSLQDKMNIALPAAVIVRGNWIFQWNAVAIFGVALGLSGPEVSYRSHYLETWSDSFVGLASVFWPG